MDKPLIRTTRAVCVGLLLCTAVSAGAESHPQDPYEGVNRVVFKFNDKADQYVLKPIAKGYQKVTPKPARTAIGNFFDNLRDVNSFASNILRGNVKNAGYDFMRVAVNSTFGLGGLINIADEAGMQNNKNTLGDTFASWGWKNSNYLVVPLAGPSTVRDTVGSAITTVYSVERGLIPNQNIRYPLAALNAVDRREGLLELTETLDQMAIDKYIVTRDAYMALRNKQIGNPLPEQEELPDPEADAEQSVPENVLVQPESEQSVSGSLKGTDAATEPKIESPQAIGSEPQNGEQILQPVN